MGELSSPGEEEEEEVSVPGEIQFRKRHPRSGCHLHLDLLPLLQLVWLPGEEVRMETHLSRGRRAWFAE